MVSLATGYYREAFQVVRVVTWGDLLYPTIFNMVVDSVVQHWVLMVAGGSGVQNGWGRDMLHRTYFFYADNSVVASTDPDWLQG